MKKNITLFVLLFALINMVTFTNINASEIPSGNLDYIRLEKTRSELLYSLDTEDVYKLEFYMGIEENVYLQPMDVQFFQENVESTSFMYILQDSENYVLSKDNVKLASGISMVVFNYDIVIHDNSTMEMYDIYGTLLYSMTYDLLTTTTIFKSIVTSQSIEDMDYYIGFKAGVNSIDQDQIYLEGQTSIHTDDFFDAGVESVDLQAKEDASYYLGKQAGLIEGAEFEFTPYLWLQGFVWYLGAIFNIEFIPDISIGTVVFISFLFTLIPAMFGIVTLTKGK